ncbi:hypothetical protein CVU83_00795 [Candidatus Falkowbacteria bacterium HGW-Falkowbacteria-2]|uniref:Uncharacterized protein n=1 Tax=Candidatus Falkowbacteria bacterium HGW-Falkowbacteria-2 TaxID=2013769 RepID=A0A2N2E308_9BACT|nr:MAG: hypothetical protein CVU83_00795 [Candidatus Falkowbacteria bacterium HGW-Falkowbacteria-2]
MDNIFSENKQLIVKGAKNCSEENNNHIPSKIPLNNIKMEGDLHKQIIERFSSKRKKKIAAKAKKVTIA